jgi:hypothetical protein
MSKRALLVGINNFATVTPNLNGCINDTATMRGLLTGQFGFADGEVRVLTDKAATSQGIRDGLSWLLRDYDQDDVRVFHFSSHGSQVADQTGDEWDCFDEVIVPYDHDWDNPFRDDDLRAIFETVPDSVNFTFVADCCHSGTIQKAILPNNLQYTVRGIQPPEAVREAIAQAQIKRDADAKAYLGKALKHLLTTGSPLALANLDVEALAEQMLNKFRRTHYNIVPTDKHVLVAACKDEQTAADAHIDQRDQGACTWALAKAVADRGPTITYAELITAMGTNLRNYGQQPQLVCPERLRNQRLFAPLA